MAILHPIGYKYGFFDARKNRNSYNRKKFEV